MWLIQPLETVNIYTTVVSTTRGQIGNFVSGIRVRRLLRVCVHDLKCGGAIRYSQGMFPRDSGRLLAACGVLASGHAAQRNDHVIVRQHTTAHTPQSKYLREEKR